MKKLALDLDGLAVESFDTAPAAGRGGTVHARSGTTYADESCNGTCDFSCAHSCVSCAWTCDAACPSWGGTCAGSCAGATCGSTCDYPTCAQPESCWMNIC